MKTLGIRTILISNFTFDAIFHYMYQNSEKSVKNEQNYECSKIVKNYKNAYNMIDGLLYLPGQIPLRPFDYEPLLEETKNWNKVSRFIMKLPLVHRPLLLSSKETRKKY